MKNIIAILLVGMLLVGGVATAQVDAEPVEVELVEVEEVEIEEVDTDLPPAGLTPDSPFYFLDRFFEGIGTLFTFANSARARRYLALAEERLAEVKVLAEANSENTETAVALYEEQLDQANTNADESEEEDAAEKVAEATGKHTLVLDRILEKVPEKAKLAIKRAKDKSIKGQLQALRRLTRQNPGKAIGIFRKAAGRRLNKLEKATKENDDEATEESLKEYEEYAKFGQEISELAKGIRTGEVTVEELVEKATSRHIDVLRRVRQKASVRAQQRIQRTLEKEEQALQRIEIKVQQALERGEGARQRIEEKTQKAIEKGKEGALEKGEEALQRVEERVQKALDKGEKASQRVGEQAEKRIQKAIAPVVRQIKRGAAAPSVGEVSMVSGNLFFNPKTLTLAKNQPVKITFQNTGSHTFTIDELGVNIPLRGNTAVVEFTPTKSGSFEYYCAIPGHREGGMFGSVVVEE